MAKVKKSIILEKISGTLYGIVFKQYRSGVVISKIPDMSNVKRSEKQVKCNQQFAASVAQARTMLNDPEQRQNLIEKRAGLPHNKRSSLYHMAMQECLVERLSINVNVSQLPPAGAGKGVEKTLF
jgi:hypothetical protein